MFYLCYTSDARVIAKSEDFAALVKQGEASDYKTFIGCPTGDGVVWQNAPSVRWGNWSGTARPW